MHAESAGAFSERVRGAAEVAGDGMVGVALQNPATKGSGGDHAAFHSHGIASRV